MRDLIPQLETRDAVLEEERREAKVRMGRCIDTTEGTNTITEAALVVSTFPAYLKG